MEIKIFWCRFNKYFAQKWQNFLDTQKDTKKNSILIASCVVTDRAKKKFVKEVRKNIEAGKFVYLTGCGAFMESGRVDEDWFYSHYHSLFDYRENIRLLPEDIKTTEKISSDSNLYTKKFVLVQFGCDNHCSFCMTVKKRGSHKNRTKEDILEEIQELERKWAKEIVLTGINTWAWGLKTTIEYPNNEFPKLMNYLLANTDISRYRLSSIWPEFIGKDRFSMLENDRILPYFHLSVQSASDNILKLMWRHYDRDYLYELLEKLNNIPRKVPINIWADIIVWFPQESEENFQQTYDFIKDSGISKLHVFPFSSHQYADTVAASKLKGQLDTHTKNIRKRKLIELWDKNMEKLKKSTIWKEVSILVEDNNTGWTENYISVELDGNYKKWDIVKKTL